ncbi:cyclic GMP-AMP synthase-like isoform X2 [Coccinella septempunctata]|uniref:cyclic GMP-AMP synthase-like isoform X2 n=1 Tax=Coccinella septempunctata TaxID=41139 RepID=UPI001D099011|nr:cyclic GMP-AMP synthase-like isoform X2 [Coccinella septempunctata]
MTALGDFSSLSIGTRSRVPVSPELEQDKKKYNAMEPALQEIHKATGLSSKDKNYHNSVLHTTIDEIVEEMKKVDPLFKCLYNKKFYGGSYYDGLKLHSPDEYDLDLALKLPTKLNHRLEISDVHGFVRIYVNLESMKQEINYKDYRPMEKFVDKNYLLTNRFREWFEAVLNKAKNNLNGRNRLKFDLSKSGPAMTLKIQINGKLVSVDLVPALIFGKKDWPGPPFRENPITTKDEFLVVPKDPPSVRQVSNNSWRLSFQEQEKEVINGKNGLKDTIRLLKLLRTRQFQETTLASYYIKTIMMWLKDGVDDTFWLNSRSYIFMMGLKYFSKLLKRREIPYYWNQNYNLLIAANPKTIENCSNRIDKIIKTLETSISQPNSDIKTTLFDFMGIPKQILGVSEEPGQRVINAIVSSQNDRSTCIIS